MLGGKKRYFESKGDEKSLNLETKSHIVARVNKSVVQKNG